MNVRNLVRATVFATALLGTSGLAWADPPGWPNGILSGIDAMKKLPADSFAVVESQGRVLLVSTNGHYAVLDGRIMDMWNGFEIRSVADAERSLSIPLERMGLGVEELSGVMLGKAEIGRPRVVTMFVDPASPATGRILPHIRSLATRYPIHLVFVPAKSERKSATQALLCSVEAARDYVATGRLRAGDDVSLGCGLEQLKRNIVTVQVLGIKTLPFTIASNGRVAAGIPEDLGQFLETNLELSQ